ncbi:MAG: EpsI family protein [Erythrobacter sp.]|nr:EpsI family protein [Erythrobacter sp.]
MGERIARRDLLIGGLLAAGGVGALAVRPLSEPPPDADRDISALFPDMVGRWRAAPAREAILPPRDALSEATYDRITARRYLSDGPPITLVAAYRAAQDWTAQVHRPEICYPASGFSILEEAERNVPIGALSLPAGVMRAERGGRIDTVLYWTRMAQDYPGSVWGQRRELAAALLTGQTIDGIVVRLSMTDYGESPDFAPLFAFTRALYAALPGEGRRLVFGPLR